MPGKGNPGADVLVVGAGPVGLFAALRLCQKGLDVQIVEAQWRGAARSYALALHPRSLRLLREAGVLDELVSRGNRVDALAFYEGPDRQLEVKLGDTSGEFPFILVIAQQALEEVLATRLNAEGVSVLWNHRVSSLKQDEDSCQVLIDRLSKESTGYAVARTEWVLDQTEEWDVGFVLGADGHRSTVRRSLDVPFEKYDDLRQYAVFEFTTESDASNEMSIALDEHSTNVLWPLSKGRFRWSFQLTEADAMIEPRVKRRLFVQIHSAGFPYARKESLEQFIEQRAPWFQHPIQEVAWSATVGFERALAKRFGRGRAWLVGDAAHLAWPVGVQSMNLGLSEAYQVAGHLEKVLKSDASPRLLDGWAEEQRGLWLRLLGIESSLEVVPGTDPWVASRLRRFPSSIPASGEDLESLLGTMGIRRSESR